MITSDLTVLHAEARSTELRRQAAHRLSGQGMSRSRRRRVLRMPRLLGRTTTPAGRIASA